MLRTAAGWWKLRDKDREHFATWSNEQWRVSGWFNQVAMVLAVVIVALVAYDVVRYQLFWELVVGLPGLWLLLSTVRLARRMDAYIAEVRETTDGS